MFLPQILLSCLVPAVLGTFSPEVEQQLGISQQYWNGFAEGYVALNNKITIHSARELHRHMDLQNAESVVEVGAGGGIGTQDLMTYLNTGSSLTVTDFSSAMIEQAKKRLASNLRTGIALTIEEANALDLKQIESSSKDRYISNLCLPLVPEPDTMFKEARRVLKSGGIAGFTIWGQEENSGQFTIFQRATEEVRMAQGMAPHSNVPLQSNLAKLRERIENAGFDQVVIWPYWAITELWDSDSYVEFFLSTNKKYQQASVEDQQRLHSTMRRIAREWIANGKPIALETYIILARVA